VGLFTSYKLFIQKPTYIYVKLKVGQGYWWATTQRPNQWFVKGIQQQEIEQKDISGKPIVKILDVSYYPYYGTGQYDIYVIAQLNVSQIGNKGTYNFNREIIGIGSPINLEFKNVQFSGTIIDISPQPIQETFVEKTVYLTKKTTQSWEFEAIKVGDTFKNDKKTLFEILDKSESDRYSGFETGQVSGFVNDQGQQLTGTIQTIPVDTETYTYITLKTKMLLKKEDDQLFFGEELAIAPGRQFGITIPSAVLSSYIVTKVE
jgi:hypothetical protein